MFVCVVGWVEVWILECLVTLLVEMETELNTFGELEGWLFSVVDILLLFDDHHLAFMVHCGCDHSISDLLGNDELHIILLF